MNRQRAFAEMSDDELREIMIQVLNDPSTYPYSNFEASQKELQKRMTRSDRR